MDYAFLFFFQNVTSLTLFEFFSIQKLKKYLNLVQKQCCACITRIVYRLRIYYMCNQLLILSFFLL